MSRGSYSTVGFNLSAPFVRCRLVQLDGVGAGQSHSLDDGELVVGNSTECRVLVQHDTVSRRHFSVYRGAAAYMIRDLESTNGTYVNGVRIKEAYLHPGVVIHAGRVSFRVDAI